MFRIGSLITAIFYLLITLSSCSESTAGGDDLQGPGSGAEASEPIAWPVMVGGDRPAPVFGPTDWTGDTPLPLVVLLHGYGVFGELQDILWDLRGEMDSYQFLLAMPDGTRDEDDRRFWNATPGCCNFFDSEVDDVGYLQGLVSELSERVAVDDTRVYFAGHSNGGFMSYRLACESPQSIAAIASLAGSTFLTSQECADGAAVPVLQIHGNGDTRIPYEGITDEYPSAPTTAQRWAERAGCDLEEAAEGESLDLVPGIQGAETHVLRYEEGCEAGVDVQLWTIENGPHVPILGSNFASTLLDWLFAHSR